jgi:hypothetical protein
MGAARALTKEEKASIAVICERFVADMLKPRFLPMIRPTTFNYPVDIFGKWRGNKYGFITRYRSGFRENLGEEFDSAFTRFDHVERYLSPKRFDVMAPTHGTMVPPLCFRDACRGVASHHDRRAADAILKNRKVRFRASSHGLARSQLVCLRAPPAWLRIAARDRKNRRQRRTPARALLSVIPNQSTTFLCSPGSRWVPVARENATFKLLTTLPGASQNSATSGVTFNNRMLGSSGLSHQTFAGIDHSSRIFRRSALISALPDTET